MVDCIFCCGILVGRYVRFKGVLCLFLFFLIGRSMYAFASYSFPCSSRCFPLFLTRCGPSTFLAM